MDNLAGIFETEVNVRTRKIRGADDDLYEPDSRAHHAALEQLRPVLLDVGYKVVKKSPREHTLRVYPFRLFEYPLLNPVFGCGPICSEGQFSKADHETFNFAVYSRGNTLALGERLSRFESGADCLYSGQAGEGDRYRRHGFFVLPTRFKGEANECEVDFEALLPGLERLLGYLRR